MLIYYYHSSFQFAKEGTGSPLRIGHKVAHESKDALTSRLELLFAANSAGATAEASITHTATTMGATSTASSAAAGDLMIMTIPPVINEVIRLI